MKPTIKKLIEALKTSSGTEIDLSGCGLGPLGASSVADYVRDATASVTTLVLDEGELSGTKIMDKGRSWEKIEQLDADLSGFEALCLALASSQIITLSLKKCYLGPQAIALLADATSKMASIARISVLSNPIGVEGATALIDVYERNENLRTLLGIEEGVTELNLAKKQVDPRQAMGLAKELQTGRAQDSYKTVGGRVGQRVNT